MHARGALALQIFYFIFYNIGIFYKYLKVIWKKKDLPPPPTHAQKKALIKKSSNHSKKKGFRVDIQLQ